VVDDEPTILQFKDNENLKQTSVVMLTTSNSERDMTNSYTLQASGYVYKPATLDDFEKVMERIEEYWFVLCKRLPTER